MKLDELEKSWVNEKNEGSVQRELWNAVADDFVAKPIPDFETNEFLKLVEENCRPGKTMTALDIGCGAGGYSFALAGRIASCVGNDISPKMIDHAKAQAKKLGLSNTEFSCLDWAEADIDALGLRQSFDIVFAHMTPAISDFATLDKLNACSRAHCIIQKPDRRYNALQQSILELLGLPNSDAERSDMISNTFSYLWARGYDPKLYYRTEPWHIVRPLSQACDWYINRARLSKALSSAEEQKVRGYLASQAVNGEITENSTTSIVTVYWTVN